MEPARLNYYDGNFREAVKEFSNLDAANETAATGRANNHSNKRRRPQGIVLSPLPLAYEADAAFCQTRNHPTESTLQQALDVNTRYRQALRKRADSLDEQLQHAIGHIIGSVTVRKATECREGKHCCVGISSMGSICRL